MAAHGPWQCIQCGEPYTEAERKALGRCPCGNESLRINPSLVADVSKIADRDELIVAYARQNVRAERLAEALKWVAQQFCERRRARGRWTPCRETTDCMTEWCMPCYAAAHLEDDAKDGAA